jgi:hypothetical protein
MISHKKKYGMYHWDTFDNETILVTESDDLNDLKEQVLKKYRVTPSGADVVEIVNNIGTIVASYKIG